MQHELLCKILNIFAKFCIFLLIFARLCVFLHAFLVLIFQAQKLCRCYFSRFFQLWTSSRQRSTPSPQEEGEREDRGRWHRAPGATHARSTLVKFGPVNPFKFTWINLEFDRVPNRLVQEHMPHHGYKKILAGNYNITYDKASNCSNIWLLSVSSICNICNCLTCRI